ncbi:hypothetical protein [Streptomyces katrae]|uniref:hypothetical protein n=1 Tax=Streptomyces katrae TaxID=68223 RepID=UPI0004C059A7|nr:hypothetical protein [Streptomyces katrae]
MRLDAALHRLAVTFRGSVVDPDEVQCDCHWGSAEELALLKTADVELDPDLLNRTWRETDWRDRASVLRRILPQFARALVSGSVEPVGTLGKAGSLFAEGTWQEWPAQQSEAVGEFLHAWWAHTLADACPAFPAHEVLEVCTGASGTVTPWLAVWEQQDDPTANQHLATALDFWEYDLLQDTLPLHTDYWEEEDKEKARVELTTWVVRHAPARLRVQGAPEHLLHAVRLLGLTGPDRWDDTHWPIRPSAA